MKIRKNPKGYSYSVSGSCPHCKGGFTAFWSADKKDKAYAPFKCPYCKEHIVLSDEYSWVGIFVEWSAK